MVLRRCRQLLGEEDAALDALQDIFTRILEKEVAVMEFPSSYLYTMATRICIDRLRSAPVRHAGGDGLLDEIADAGNLEGRMFARRILDLLFRRHEDSTRVMAVLHYLDGMTLEEVAEQVGLSVSAVRKRLGQLKSKSAAWAERSRSEGALQIQGKGGYR